MLQGMGDGGCEIYRYIHGRLPLLALLGDVIAAWL